MEVGHYINDMALIVIVAVIVLVGSITLNALYKRTNTFQNQFIDIVKFQRLKDDGRFDIVNLGSNHPKFAFDYTESGIKGMNWAIGPQTFMFDFIILKKYKKHLNPGAKVIIPVCPLNFFLLETHVNNLVKYYRIFSKHEMPKYDIKQKLTEYTLPVFRHPARAKRIIRDVKADNRLSITENPMNKEQIEKDATFWIEGCWNPEFNIDVENMSTLSKANQQSIDGNIRILSEMIQYCIDNDLQPVLAILPVTKELSSKFPEEFIQQHILRYINESNKQGVPVLNYLKDERFTTPDLYINSFFMNANGRKYFTKIFVNELNNKEAGK